MQYLLKVNLESCQEENMCEELYDRPFGRNAYFAWAFLAFSTASRCLTSASFVEVLLLVRRANEIDFFSCTGSFCFSSSAALHHRLYGPIVSVVWAKTSISTTYPPWNIFTDDAASPLKTKLCEKGLHSKNSNKELTPNETMRLQVWTEKHVHCCRRIFPQSVWLQSSRKDTHDLCCQWTTRARCCLSLCSFSPLTSLGPTIGQGICWVHQLS